LEAYTGIAEKKIAYQSEAWDALSAGDLPAFKIAVTRLFAGIPWRNYTNNDLAESEGYYASVLYALFTAMGCVTIPEDITNHGQADMTVFLGGNIYVMEIKVAAGSEGDGMSNPALAQIKERKYAEKYAGRAGKGVYELGLVFSREKRNLLQFDGERL
jgi:hypothetical protein